MVFTTRHAGSCLSCTVSSAYMLLVRVLWRNWTICQHIGTSPRSLGRFQPLCESCLAMRELRGTALGVVVEGAELQIPLRGPLDRNLTFRSGSGLADIGFWGCCMRLVYAPGESHGLRLCWRIAGGCLRSCWMWCLDMCWMMLGLREILASSLVGRYERRTRWMRRCRRSVQCFLSLCRERADARTA